MSVVPHAGGRTSFSCKRWLVAGVGGSSHVHTLHAGVPAERPEHPIPYTAERVSGTWRLSQTESGVLPAAKAFQRVSTTPSALNPTPHMVSLDAEPEQPAAVPEPAPGAALLMPHVSARRAPARRDEPRAQPPSEPSWSLLGYCNFRAL